MSDLTQHIPSVPQPLPPKRMGRPSGYRDEFATLAHNYCLLGATNEDLARMFDVSSRTVSAWMDAHPEFLQAIKRGREEADATIAHSFYHRAKGYSHPAVKIFLNKQGEAVTVPYTEHYPPDTVAGIFWLKNRRPDLWRDKQDHDVTVHGRIGRLPDEERSSKALQLLQRLAGGVAPGPVIDVASEPTPEPVPSKNDAAD